jgi:hypothetical protein
MNFDKSKLTAIATLHFCLFLLCGCTRNIHGGDPNLLLSTSNGISQVLPSSERSVVEAISNAFNGTGYRGMHLDSAAEDPTYFRKHSPTNGYVLFPLMGPIAVVPLRGQPPIDVPYTAIFNIVTEADGPNRTRVSVWTFSATVIDGKETGIHGGWANHTREVPPVQKEEQNVFDAISKALIVLNSKTNFMH